MSVFSRFQMRKKWALFDANQFPQPLAVVSAITFARIVFFTVCLFTEKSAKIASKFIFDFHSVSREKLNVEKFTAALHHFRDCVIGTVESHLQILDAVAFFFYHLVVFVAVLVALLDKCDIVVFDAVVSRHKPFRQLGHTFLKPIELTAKALLVHNFVDFVFYYFLHISTFLMLM